MRPTGFLLDSLITGQGTAMTFTAFGSFPVTRCLRTTWQQWYTSMMINEADAVSVNDWIRAAFCWAKWWEKHRKCSLYIIKGLLTTRGLFSSLWLQTTGEENRGAAIKMVLPPPRRPSFHCIFIYATPASRMSFVVSAQLALHKIVAYSFNPRRYRYPRPLIISHKTSHCAISILNKLPCAATCLYLSSPNRRNYNT